MKSVGSAQHFLVVSGIVFLFLLQWNCLGCVDAYPVAGEPNTLESLVRPGNGIWWGHALGLGPNHWTWTFVNNSPLTVTFYKIA